MRIYAKIEAEKLIDGKIVKVSKQQGSNTKIEFDITLDGVQLAGLTVLPSGTIVIDEGRDCELVINEFVETKGEKKKGEVRCEICGNRENMPICTSCLKSE